VAENENGQEKTEEATPKRLDKSREEGEVARSKELTTTLVLLSGVLALISLGGDLAEAMKGAMRFNFILPREVLFDSNLMLNQLTNTATMAMGAVAPFFIILSLAAFIGPVMLGGFLFSTKTLVPKLSRISPLAGIKRMFSPTSLVELLKALAKFFVVAAIAITMLYIFNYDLLNLAQLRLGPAVDQMVSIIGLSILAISASMIIIAVIDVPFQIFDHAKKMRMTLQEVKDEMKDTEGKPEVKSKVRQLQMQMAQRRMMESVPDADVIITNPEHFSVALKYDVEGGGAPIVVAKGVDFMAIKIREIAKAHDVLMLPAPPLARAIYFTTEIDQEIPGALYLAVAQVLAYVFQLRTYNESGGKKPKPLADIVLPRETQYDVDGTPAPEI
jgi:flagellar biosynthetic protein FlhB